MKNYSADENTHDMDITFQKISSGKLQTWGKVWCWFGLISEIVGTIYYVVFLLLRVIPFEPLLLSYIIGGPIRIVGYILLLRGQKLGFLFNIVPSALLVIYHLMSKNIFYALGVTIVTIILWLAIKNLWKK